MPPPSPVWHALIRTHHITSRRKVAKLRQAADQHAVAVLLKTGAPPGVMYVRGQKAGVEAWVDVVKRLRYKDYQLVSRPAEIVLETVVNDENNAKSGIAELTSVKDFGEQMHRQGAREWWRQAMGYV